MYSSETTLDFASAQRASQSIAMENGVEMYKDKPLKTKLPHNFLFILAMVITNIVALISFSELCNYTVNNRRQYPPVESDLEQHPDSTAVVLARTSERLMLQLNSSRRDMQDTLNELVQVRRELQGLREQSEVVFMQIGDLVKGTAVQKEVHEALQHLTSEDQNNPWSQWSKGEMSRELQEFTTQRKLPLGWNPALNSDSIVSSVGHACALHKDDIDKYMDYVVGQDCPDDESLAQKLLLGGCEPLPRRRCFAHKPGNYTEPVPYPKSLWTIPEDNNILWTAHPCKSFECLNERSKKKVFADCLDCFDLDGREKHRWVDGSGTLDFTIEEVLLLKPKGTIKIGLDIGGGTGSFAARMRELEVTIVTSTLNLNGPFNNFIAHRGLVPLFLTVSQRLPFADNTLDIVHSMHVLSNWIPTESLEFVLFDIDRVLRPGGLFWLDHFFCVEEQLETYVPMIERLGYKKLKWTIGAKLDRGPELMERYISALLEKRGLVDGLVD